MTAAAQVAVALVGLFCLARGAADWRDGRRGWGLLGLIAFVVLLAKASGRVG